MKNHLSLGIISVLTVFVQSCAPSTAVRVLSLSYEGQPERQPLNKPEKLTNRFNGPKRADDEETYIFPGDILTFTVELEDPNYEFISLLAIRFNGQTIRANSDDSIVTTRDCGPNICVDFPFEIQAEVTEYVVQEVKFAKLSSDSGVNAIIDSNSENAVIVDIYNEEILPYVERSVENLNNGISKLSYYETPELFNEDDRPQYSGRVFYIGNYDDELNWFSPIEIKGPRQDDKFGDLEQKIIVECGSYYFGAGGAAGVIDGPLITYNFYSSDYHATYFYNEKNSIYVSILSTSYLVFELEKSQQIHYFNPIPK
jgi:hypothetical protein